MTISCAPWQYMTIYDNIILFNYFSLFYIFNLFTYSMFFYVLYDLSHRINFADLTPRRHWGWFARLCRSDLHLGPQPFQGTGPQRLRMPSTSQYSISPDLLKESLVSEEWKRWIENKEKFRADLVGGSAEGQKSNCVCRGQAFTTLSCWSEVFDHFRVNGDTWLLMIKHGRSSRCHALPKCDSGAPLLLKAHESKDFDLSQFYSETPIYCFCIWSCLLSMECGLR